MRDAISLEEARMIMRSLVLAKGEDYVYPRANTSTCEYFDAASRKADCLIGHVFAVIGVDPSDVHEGVPAHTNIQRMFPLTESVVYEALTKAQQWQDKGGTWGEALAAFEQALVA